jgi:hypothetical protein
MQHHRGPDNDGGSRGCVSRREVVAGGGLLLGSLLLGGCAGNKGATAGHLPGPYWADPGSTAPITNDIHSAPITYAPPSSVPTARPDFTPPPGIVPRSMWARTGVARPAEINFMNGIRRITVHHDGMPPTSLGSTNQVTGRIWEGRSTQYQGAHVKDQNEHNLGILLMGNFMVQSPTQAALASLDRFLLNQMQRYNVSMTAVRTHQERAPTECPGRNLQAYMNRTRTSTGTLHAMASRVGLARG